MLKYLILPLLFAALGSRAASRPADSLDLSAGARFRQHIDRVSSTESYRMLFLGAPLIVGGVVMQSYDADFRRLRNGYAASFHQTYDDWLQYAPAAAMLGIKAAGVKGRSSWGRMLVSDAFSAGLMAIAVNSLKYTCRVMRPDGSQRNSFPSGHTATAFMTATMLHKEYGHRSPWYSIGGYVAATVTGVTRQLNNRHWMSDIMVGAGIGILATEFGYYLADLIFKDKGLFVTDTYVVHDRYRKPSFLSFSLATSIAAGRYTPYPGMEMKLLAGPTVGVQGAWFASTYWGVGGRMSCSNLRVKVNNVAEKDNLEIVSGMAPEALNALPAPDRAFIGGSSGKLLEIVELLLSKNPDVRMVVNSITLETAGEIARVLERHPELEQEIVQIQASRAKKAGPHHLMMGENPVTIAILQRNNETEKGEAI